MAAPLQPAHQKPSQMEVIQRILRDRFFLQDCVGDVHLFAKIFFPTFWGRWAVFCVLCLRESISQGFAIVQQLADFFIHLHQLKMDKLLCQLL